jgi:hypothetical protein
MTALSRAVRAALVAATALVLATTPAGAVVGGQQDASNVYANVGQLEMNFGGEWFGVCSATLVEEDVLLTAAHCMDFVVVPGGLGIENVRVTFDPTPDDGSVRYQAVAAEVHPDWFLRPALRGNSKRLGLAPPAEDMALVWLAGPVAGVDPAPIVDAGALDALDLKRETFTVVGYGLTGFVKGTIVSAQPEVSESGRNYKHVTAVTEHDAFGDRFVKIPASTCFGDSGGPLFHGDTVVAVNTWTSSARCEASSYSYRLDAPRAQWFLGMFLD